MKEFRVAKCVNNGKIEEYTIFKDGSRKKRIYVDDKGRKYFEVDNELNDNASSSFLRRSFSGRIKDAIETIRMGNGDCLKVENFFGRHESVLYFLDRTIGEEFRKNSIEGWKDTKFGWVIKVGSNNSFYEYQMLGSNYTTISSFSESETPMYFESEGDAKKYIDDLLKMSKQFAKKLNSKLSEEVNTGEDDEIIYSVINEIEEYTGSEWSIVTDFMEDMYKNDYRLKDKGYRIEQCIVK